MSQPFDNLHSPHHKPYRRLPIKFIDIFTIVMKSFLAICLVASVSLISYLIFSNHTRWFTCSQCHDSLVGTRSNLDVFEYDQTNISHIIFGIGGSAETWNNRRHYCEIWWKPDVMRGFVWLDEEPASNETWPETSPPYKVSGDSSRFQYTCWYGSRSAVRIARIVKESFELQLENVRWFVMGDDDTVFFPENLVAVLEKYDYNEMYYVGGVSESVEQDVTHSYSMGYGGAGFAISYPLAVELVRVLDSCIDRYASFYGSDQKIGGCMSEIGVPLTKELGFHQVDIRGNPYGLLAAHPLAPLVSLHHLDYVQSLFPGMGRVDSVKKIVKSYKSDPSRALQHTFCYDLKRKWSISIAWGYTVQLYPSLLTAKELETPLQTFLSWRNYAQEPFTFNTRTMSLEPCMRPIIYYFDGVQELKNRQILTSYNRANAESHRRCNTEDYSAAISVKKFNVMAPTLDPQVWKKAPRRQCCEVMKSKKGMVDDIVQVKIRDCDQWESVTPP